MSDHVLWYREPARTWTQALPVGNGALGAMCFGDLADALVQLNDETAWSGSPQSESAEPVVSAEDARTALDAARAHMTRGEYAEADAAVRRLQHRHTQAYLPFGDLRVQVTARGEAPDTAGGPAQAYRRELDLTTATHSAIGPISGIAVSHSTWVSRPHGVLVHTFESEEPVDVQVLLDTPLRETRRDGAALEQTVHVRLPTDVVPGHDEVDDPIRYAVDEESVAGVIHARVETDGVAEGDSIRNARTVTVVLATDTTFTRIGEPLEADLAAAEARARARVEAALADGIDTVRARQLADHAALYDAASIRLGDSTHDGSDTLSRLRAVNGSDAADLPADAGLAALLFHYGRYLLICSSRPGGLPATLQGIWNDQLRPPWSSNYTTNINVEMNYWGAHTTSLSETEDPLVALIAALAVRGTETAERLYDAPGWVAHHNTDAWAYTQPVGGGEHDPAWAFWPMAGLWLCLHLADRDRFGVADRQEQERTFDIVRGAVEFAQAWVSRQPDGTLGTLLSTSPETDFTTADGARGSVARSATLDLVLLHANFGYLTDLAERLGRADDPVVVAARDMLPGLPAIPLTDDGSVAEWRDAVTPTDPHHRHVSPLLFAYPGVGELDEVLAAATRRFLDLRGDESTGWSLAWKLALRARLSQPDRVDHLLALVFRDMRDDRGGESGGLYDNLLAAHPPFQIDGNLGYTAAVAEMLVHSHGEGLRLLPAVPASFGSGEVRGLVARPGVALAFSWDMAEDAPRLTSLRMRAMTDAAKRTHRVDHPGGALVVTLDDGEWHEVDLRG